MVSRRAVRRVAAAFAALDAAGSGTLAYAQFSKGDAAALGVATTREMWRKLDADKAGEVRRAADLFRDAELDGADLTEVDRSALKLAGARGLRES